MPDNKWKRLIEKHFFKQHIYLFKTLKFNEIALKFHFGNDSLQKFDLNCFDWLTSAESWYSKAHQF